MAAPNRYLQSYNAIRSNIAAKISDPTLRARSLQQFDADPRVQKLRAAAGLAPVSTVNGDVRALAKQSQQLTLSDLATGDTPEKRFAAAGADVGKNSGVAQSASAGISHIGLAGIPEMVAAAAERWLPSAVTGNNTDASYGNILQTIRARDEAAIAANPTAAAVGGIGGSVLGGRVVGRVVGSLASRAAAAASPLVARIGQAVQGATALQKGQTVRNVARIAGTGAAAGATQAEGTGNDPTEGAAEGAAGATVLHGAIGTAKFIRNAVGFEPVASVLQRFVKTPIADIQAAMQARAKAGLPSSIYEVLPFADREALDDGIARMPASSRAGLASAVRQRAQNMVGETSDAIGQAVDSTRNPIRDQVAQDLATSRRGTAPTDEETQTASNAVKDPTDMAAVQGQEARNIMAPHDDLKAFNSVSDLFPQDHGQNLDPEASALIRTAAGSLALRPPADGLTIRDTTDILSKLSKFSVSADPIVAGNARRASEHVMAALETAHPEIADDIQQMRTAYGNRQTMIDGMLEGAQSRTRAAAGFDGQDPSTVRRNYDTPQGSDGRALGQASAIDTNVLRSPAQSTSALNKLATDPTTQAAVSGNLGEDAGKNITDIAKLQSTSAQNLSGLDKEIPAGSNDNLLSTLMAVTPGTLPSTKVRGFSRLIQGTMHIPQPQADNLVSMLFSQNPTQISRAAGILSNTGEAGRAALQALAGGVGATTADQFEPQTAPNAAPALPTVQMPASAAEVPADAGAPQATDPSKMSDDQLMQSIKSDPSKMSDDELMQAIKQNQSPYAAQWQHVQATENPALLSLLEKQGQQESHGNPDAVSKKGAVGIGQVMPATAPEAAKLANVPWDPNAYHSDPSYQKLLQHGYMSKLLVKYGGDTTKALAAYNAGPGAVDEALSSGAPNWLATLPAETQSYVPAIVGSGQ